MEVSQPLLLGSAMLVVSAYSQSVLDIARTAALYTVDDALRKRALPWWRRLLYRSRGNAELARDYGAVEGLPAPDEIHSHDWRAVAWMGVAGGSFLIFMEQYANESDSVVSLLTFFGVIAALGMLTLGFIPIRRRLIREYEEAVCYHEFAYGGLFGRSGGC